MKAFSTRLATVTLLGLSLGACSQIFGGKHLYASAPAEPAAPLLASSQPITDGGRRHLDADHYGQAIESFRIAITAGEAPAPAYNGMAVAYARIGRSDLAERFFRQAVALAPDEDRYQQNLARLMVSPEFLARAAPVQPAEVAVAEPAASLTALQGSVQLAEQAGPSGKLERIGKNQFHIRSVEAMPAPVRMAIASRPRMQAVPANFKPALRLELAPATQGAAPESKIEPRMIDFKPIVRFALPRSRR